MSVGKLELGGDAPVRAMSGDPLRALVERLPRPFRFLGVGALGLTVDVCIFTILIGYEPRPLLTRLVSLGGALLVTWRLNRALTDRKSTRLNSSHLRRSRMPSSA